MNKESNFVVKIPKKIYEIYTPILVPDNLVLDGNGATFVSHLSNDQAVFEIKSKSNINISNLNIIADGKFVSGDENLLSCGFSNSNTAINIDNSKNVKIYNVKIHGFGCGINIGSGYNKLVSNIYVGNSQFSQLGQSAIRVVYAKNIIIENNQIESILGNQTKCVKNWLDNSKFADGIYLENVESVIISKNFISNVKRIAIAFDNRANSLGVIPLPNHDILVNNNKIYNFNSCRGTENNAAIWVEPWQESTFAGIVNIDIKNNVIDNYGAVGCKKNQYGIFSGANKSIIENNSIKNINTNGKRSFGIRCAFGECLIINNNISNVNNGILLMDIQNSSNITIKNVINSNERDVIYEK